MEVEAMQTSKAIQILNTIKNGTFGVIEYQTALPVNKEAKNAGIQVICRTKKMVRFGADYKNLVSDLASTEVKPRKNNYTWVLKNKVAHNSSTEKDYLRISNINRKTISREYFLLGDGGVKSSPVKNLAEFENLLQPSYLKNTGYSKPIVQNISIENIISINGNC